MNRLAAKAGFTILEALVSVVLIVITLTAALYTINVSSVFALQADKTNAIVVARNNFVNVVLNPRVWQMTVDTADTDPENASLECLRTTTDCAGAGGTFRIYDTDGNLYYDPVSATQGLDYTGLPCTGFVAPGAAGNMACPLRVTLRWDAICPPAPAVCLRPLVQISMQASVNTPHIKTQLAMNRLNSVFYQGNQYCPSAPTVSLAAVNTGAPPRPDMPTAQQVVSDTLSTVAVNGYAVSGEVNPCVTMTIRFRDDVGGIPRNHVNNVSSFCAFDATAADPNVAPCLFEWRHYYDAAPLRTDTFDLLQNGVVVYSHPSNYNSGNVMSFVIKNGRLSFRMDDRPMHYFLDPVVVAGIRFRVRVAPGQISPGGINGIVFQ